MNLLWFLGAISMFLLQERAGTGAMTLNSVLLRQLQPGRGGGASVCSPAQYARRRRSWVWNQFFVLEEFTGDEPLYVGKVRL